MNVPSFSVIPGTLVRRVLAGRATQVTDVIEAAYRLHGEGRTVNPDSYFLRFPDRPSARIIALPASVGGNVNVHGMKWIASFPENITSGLPRASAVLILNDTETGLPFACLESSLISAYRTAASAALAANRLSTQRGVVPRRAGFVGTGPIAESIHMFLKTNGFRFDDVGVHDLVTERATAFRDRLQRVEPGLVTVHDDIRGLIHASDLIVFATTASTPHVTDPALFDHNPLVLHISLRDLSPEVVLSSWNVTDDVEHCMKAATSLHLTEQVTGNREFVAGELPDVLAGRVTCPANRPAVFSPFGLGVLDLALGRYVYDRVAEEGLVCPVPGFFTHHDNQGSNDV
nr:ornithine cyclodeaminase [uncultured bacterium]